LPAGREAKMKKIGRKTQRKEDKEKAWRKEKKEKMQRKEEKEKVQRKEEKYQRDLAHCLEADCVTAIKQQCCRNWSKTFLLPLNFSSNKEMNLIDLLSLTKRQCV